MTPEETQKIDDAELAIQKAYRGDGDLLKALNACRKVYAECGLISNRVTTVDSSIKVITALRKTVFKSKEERAAIREAAAEEAAAVEKEALKETLYEEHMAKKAKKK